MYYYARKSTRPFVGVYDAIPNIVAAYGMRQLLTSYTGNLVRIRRSSDDAQQDFGYDANGDLDTVAIATFVGGGSGFVTRLYDQSGNGYNVDNGVAANQPLYVADGQNSRPTTRFDGSNDYLTYATPANIFPDSSALTVLATYKATASGERTLFQAANTGGVSYHPRWTDNNAYWTAGDTTAANRAIWAATIGSFEIVSLVRNSVLTAYKNGVSKATSTGKAAYAVGGSVFFLGTFDSSQRRFAGDVAEFVVCTSALSDANRQAAEAVAANYWGITLS